MAGSRMVTSPSVALSPAQWSRDVARLASDDLDVLVVGGGVVGAGAALDAATRGLRVGIVEAQDWASGTSSRSSKLVHGGLRYLAMLDLHLVREALHERAVLLETAPHLVRPVAFLYPLRRRVRDRAVVGAGVGLYDLLARSAGRPGSLPSHRHLTRERALALAPALRAAGLVGAVEYFDAQVDDARHTLALVRTAVSHGAIAASRVRADGLVAENGRVRGARIVLEETGSTALVRARVVIAATGVWPAPAVEDAASPRGDVRGAPGDRRPGAPVARTVRPSKGVHLVLARERISSERALIVPTVRSVLFVLPWGAHWIVGTTDTEWPYDASHVAASGADVDYLIGELNAVLATPVSRRDVESVFVGLRPLVAGKELETTRLSREHAVGCPTPGVVVVSGGKYTTYRVMARDAVDAAVADARLGAPASATDRVGLVGASFPEGRRAYRDHVADAHALGRETVDRLCDRYGSLAGEVLAPAVRDSGLARPITGAPAYLRAEARYAVTHEGARHLEDVLARRTRASIDAPRRGLDAAEEVAELVGEALGWDRSTVGSEVADYRRGVEAQELAESAPDDARAFATVCEDTRLLPPP